jgi:hypothetical protein
MVHGARSTVVIDHLHVASSSIALKKLHEERISELSKKMYSETRKFSEFYFVSNRLPKENIYIPSQKDV